MPLPRRQLLRRPGDHWCPPRPPESFRFFGQTCLGMAQADERFGPANSRSDPGSVTGAAGPPQRWLEFPENHRWLPPAAHRSRPPVRESFPGRRRPPGGPIAARGGGPPVRTRGLRRGDAAIVQLRRGGEGGPQPPRRGALRAAPGSRHLRDRLEILEEDGFCFPDRLDLEEALA